MATLFPFWLYVKKDVDPLPELKSNQRLVLALTYNKKLGIRL
jgi:hypothetical protein